MYLLNASTLELEEFFGWRVPPYAILSHRWAEDELNFKEVSKNRADTQKQGYIKMTTACRVTLNDFALQHLWIDTCCIDKRSSAELSEAINSMYRWYQNAAVCIVYLHDVEEVISVPNNDTTCSDSSWCPRSDLSLEMRTRIVPFHQSEWFSRAWTLQELLAPAEIHFYNFEWKNLGTKDSLDSQLVRATGIPSEALLGMQKPEEFSFAEKMRWASCRYATKEEDYTYSLLGLFNINMPLLYGEGEKAFVRFQEEFLKTTADLTFLFWGIGNDSSRLLARSPADFAQSLNVRIDKQIYEAFSLNNVGLNIELEIGSYDWGVYGVRYYMGLDQQQHMLVLRRVIGTKYLCRIGNMVDDPSCRRLDSRRHRVTILRYSQHEEGHWMHHPSAFCGLRLGESICAIEPCKAQLIFHRALNEWKADRATGHLQCWFGYPLSLNVAQMKCRIDHRLVFISFCIDFDFIPHLYIHCGQPSSASDIITIKNRTDLEWQGLHESTFETAIVDRPDSDLYGTGSIFRSSEPIASNLPRQAVSLPIPLSGSSSGYLVRLLPPSTKPYGRIRPCWTIWIFKSKGEYSRDNPY